MKTAKEMAKIAEKSKTQNADKEYEALERNILAQAENGLNKLMIHLRCEFTEEQINTIKELGYEVEEDKSEFVKTSYGKEAIIYVITW